MGYDDVKTHDGERYAGMAVGGTHDWDYPDGRWREEKRAPDRWDFSFESEKRRRDPAPEGSGADPGTGFRWYILARQKVEKLDANTYATRMSGRKWKVAHRRPYWERWSCEYPDQAPARDRVIGILEETLERLRAEREADPQARLGAF